MTNLEQLARIIEDHEEYRDPMTDAGYAGLAQAIIDAGWTPPIQPTTPSYLDN